MKRWKWLWVVGCVAAAGVVGGCNGKRNSPADATLENRVYTNRFFGFRMQIPKDWTLLEKPSKAQLQENAAAVVGNRQTAAAAAAAADKAYYLLLAKNVGAGRAIGVAAERITSIPEVRTGKDYLHQLLQVMTGAGKPLQPTDEVTPVKLASREFYRVDVAGEVAGRQQHQGMFVRVEKGYALMILVGAKSEIEVDEVMAAVGLELGTKKEPAWTKAIKLQGISGTEAKRLAIINGKTFAKGDASTVKAAWVNVKVQCVAVREASVTVKIEGVDGERELELVRN